MVKKLTLGLSILAVTNLMAAKTASEQIGNAIYAKATINCTVDGKKDFIKDTVNIDSIGFDYTRFIPMLATKGMVQCSVKGNIQLPDDFSGDSVDIEVPKSTGFIYTGDHNNYYVVYTFNDQQDLSVIREAQDKRKTEEFRFGRFFNVPVKKYLGIKYVEYEIDSRNYYYFHELKELKSVAIPGNKTETFFKLAESSDIRYMKTAQSRGEKTEMVPLDKFFILQRGK